MTESKGSVCPSAPEEKFRTSIVLNVLTFRRPVGLRRTLDGIARLEMPACSTVSLEVMVIDNDPAGPARTAIEDLMVDFPWPLEYVVEAERGIAQARNRAVTIATARGAEMIGFIDDDDVPEPDWLVRMLETFDRTAADVVVSSFRPVFERPPPGWILAGQFFECVRFRTDENLPWMHARTSGALISTTKLPTSVLRFDERFGLTGSSDTELFRRIQRGGGKLVWCDDAAILIHVPESKASLRWIVMRQFRFGNTQGLFLVYFGNPSGLRKLRRLAGGVFRMILGIGLMFISLVRGRVAFVNAATRAAEGAGAAIGVVGVHYKEYLRTHGS